MKANDAVKAVPVAMRKVAPGAKELLAVRVAVEEIELEEVIVLSASVAAAWCAAASEVPSLRPVDRQDLAGAAAKGH